MAGTLAPIPRQQFFDNNGLPLDGGRLYTYAAGTSTPRAIYTDHTLGTAHPNPALLDGAGRITIYLVPGQSYKFVLKDNLDVFVWEQDYITSIPLTTGDLDVEAMAGTPLAAGVPVYPATDGRWYAARADTPETSTHARILGMTLSAIPAGVRGTIRLKGRVTGLAGLVAGASYYVGPTGGLALNGVRRLGVADLDGQSLWLDPMPAAMTAGSHEMFIPAIVFQPFTATGSGAAVGPHEHIVAPIADGGYGEVLALPFTIGANRFAFTWVRMPKSWNRGTVKVSLLWVNKSGPGGDVYWVVHLHTSAPGRPFVEAPYWWGVGAIKSPALAPYVFQQTADLDVGLQQVTTGNLLQIFFYRGDSDPASDTYGGNAYFVGMNLTFKTNADTDD